MRIPREAERKYDSLACCDDGLVGDDDDGDRVAGNGIDDVTAT